MSTIDRSTAVRSAILALAVLSGCATSAGPGPGAAAPRAIPFEPPPSGTTGTPADNVTDPALAGLPNPNPTVLTGWGQLPGGREWGASAGAAIGPDGHLWIYERCGGGTGGCDGSPTLDPIHKFDVNTGQHLASMGAGLFVTPHGFHVDPQGNVWVADFAGNEAGTKGHQVLKLSPTGQVLMRLGTAGVAGGGPRHFNQPTNVVVAPNGDIFVSDGHSGQNANPPDDGAGRVVKFNSRGEYLTEWGRIGNEPGEFRTPHAMAFDSRGRLFVVDRGNHRIQIFDQQGNLLDTYYQHGRVSGIFITPDDMLYTIDSETNGIETGNHPGWISGIRIGPASADRVTAFIPPHYPVPPATGRPVAGEGIAVDRNGNVYGAEGPASLPVAGAGLTRYTRAR